MSIVESFGHVVDDIGEHIVVAAREENTQVQGNEIVRPLYIIL